MRNNNLAKIRPINRKRDPKELFKNDAKLKKSDLQKSPQGNPNVGEFLSKTNEGLAIAPFPDVKILPLNGNAFNPGTAQVSQQVPKQGKDDAEKTYTVSKDQLLALRARWSKKCDKAAAKECQKSCKSALKFACQDYKCRSGLKKLFKKECKRNCKSRFIERGGC